MSRFTWSNIVGFVKESYFLGSPKWDTDQIPDLTGKVFFVTGGNAGLGKDTVRALLHHNATVYIACRSEKKAQVAITELEAETRKRAIFLEMDLADLKSVKAATEEFLSKEQQLHVLYNNAGLMRTPMDSLVNGYDMQFHVNVFGHFYLTKLLLPVLIHTAETSRDGYVRVVNVSSSGHHFARKPPLNFNTFKDSPARRHYDPDELYYQSKFANILFSNELHRRYKGQGIISTAVNPGNFSTNLGRNIEDWSSKAFLWFLCIYPANWGALTQLWAGTSPESAELGGKYLSPWCMLGTPRFESDDAQLSKELWLWLEEQIDAPY